MDFVAANSSMDRFGERRKDVHFTIIYNCVHGIKAQSVKMKFGPGVAKFTQAATENDVATRVRAGTLFGTWTLRQATANAATTTTLNSGTGADVVNVQATTGPLVIDGQDGRDRVTVGHWPLSSGGSTLGGIQGSVAQRVEVGQLEDAGTNKDQVRVMLEAGILL